MVCILENTGVFMKNIIILLLVLVAFNSFGATYYGFLNQDISYNSCFVGLEDGDFNYSGPVSNRFLSRDQRDLMEDCTREKREGQSHAIVITTTANKQVQPNGVTTHLPSFEVECVKLSQSDFNWLLTRWRSEVRASNFRRCF